ncbi:MAG: SDR family NAD(P)-dependent oxidoreductase [Pseudomonadales bacterium]
MNDEVSESSQEMRMPVNNEKPAAIVTGAASGIGRAVCERLSARDVPALAVDIDTAALAWTENAKNVVPFVADISTAAGNQGMVAAGIERFREVSAVVFNAAVFPTGPIVTMSAADIDALIAVNFRAVIHGIQAVLPALRAHGAGAIVVTSSCGGLLADPNSAVYGATKAALNHLVKATAFELGPADIRINAVCPGPTLTGPTENIPDFDKSEIFAQQASLTALQRWAQPCEIAAAIDFLLSSDASYITGAAVPVDGGWTAGHAELRPEVL